MCCRSYLRDQPCPKYERMKAQVISIANYPALNGSLLIPCCRRFHNINLVNNSLTGTLSNNWTQHPWLSSLQLSTNNLVGQLPEGWGSWENSNYLYLDLSNNPGLTGTLPAAWGLAGANSSTRFKLNMLNLANCSIQGTLPDSWSSIAPGIQTSLILSDNKLNGTIPASWGQKKAAYSSTEGSGWSQLLLTNNRCVHWLARLVSLRPVALRFSSQTCTLKSHGGLPLAAETIMFAPTQYGYSRDGAVTHVARFPSFKLKNMYFCLWPCL